MMRSDVTIPSGSVGRRFVKRLYVGLVATCILLQTHVWAGHDDIDAAEIIHASVDESVNVQPFVLQSFLLQSFVQGMRESLIGWSFDHIQVRPSIKAQELWRIAKLDFETRCCGFQRPAATPEKIAEPFPVADVLLIALAAEDMYRNVSMKVSACIDSVAISSEPLRNWIRKECDDRRIAVSANVGATINGLNSASNKLASFNPAGYAIEAQVEVRDRLSQLLLWIANAERMGLRRASPMSDLQKVFGQNVIAGITTDEEVMVAQRPPMLDEPRLVFESSSVVEEPIPSIPKVYLIVLMAAPEWLLDLQTTALPIEEVPDRETTGLPLASELGAETASLSERSSLGTSQR